MNHDTFVTTRRGLRRQDPVMRLYEKAKRLGIWNPSDIDFRQDRADWNGLNAEERDLILRLTSLFQAGEEAVTLDILPLIQVIADEGHLEEELYLTTFLFEEGKHTDFFRRFLDATIGQGVDLSIYHSEHYRALFYAALPEAMQALGPGASPAAQARAAATYNMIVEGVLAETGYHAFTQMLERRQVFPGLRKGIALLKQDESRHIAYGVFLLSRLLAEDPALWEVIERRMNELLPLALGVIGDAFSAYETPPFDLRLEDFADYATTQFARRYERLEKARDSGLVDIEE
jgi:ribonucleoside-diphosphate reductase beta chain